MTKISKVITALALSASMAFGVVSLAACNNAPQEEHKHTYATTWSSDADNHWHAPTCNDTTEVKDKAAHVDENADGKCDVCEHSVPLPHQHTYAEEWTTDANYHWHAPTCNDTEELKDKAEHIDENNDYKCDVCDYQLPVPHQHEYSEDWTTDENNHWHAPTCGDTEEVKDKAAHIDENDDEKCDVCDYRLPHNHKYAGEWTTDENYHWHAPTCGDTEEPADKAEHVDENEDYKCDVCEYDLPQPDTGTEITISANSYEYIALELEAGVYELKMNLAEGVTAVNGGLTAHVDGSTYSTNYNMYDGLNGTYSAVLTVLEDSRYITLTNTTGEDISANYSLKTYVAPTLKADGTEYVVPLIYANTATTYYRAVFLPFEPVAGNFRITFSNYVPTGTAAGQVNKNGDATTAGRICMISTSKMYYDVTFTEDITSLFFKVTNTLWDYNITVKIERID